MKKTVLLSTMVAASLVVTVPVQASFQDMQAYDKTTQQAVDYLVKENIVQGTSATTFSPQQQIKRRQVVKMLGKYLEESGVPIPQDWQTNARFLDVPVATTDRELLRYAALVYDAGVFVGSEGFLNPQGLLTRENVALILNRLAAYTLDGYDLVQYMHDENLPATVLDIASVKQEAKEAVLALNALGISNVTTFNPKGTVKRVHFASFLAKLLQKLEHIEAPQPEEPEKPTEPEKPIEPEKPVEPEKPIEPQPPTNPSEPDDGLDEPSYVVEADFVTDVDVIAVTENNVTIVDAELGQQTFTIAEELMPLFAERALFNGAVATFYIEDDVVTEVAALTVKHAGTPAQPLLIDGLDFDDMTVLTIESSYATIVNFDYHYEAVTIDAPTAASYTIGAGDFTKIAADGALQVTFTDIIHSDVLLDAPTIDVTVAPTAGLTGLAPTNELRLKIDAGATLYDVYLPAHVQTLTVDGYLETLNVETTKELTLNGTGTINTLFGAPSAVYVQKDGVVVNDLAVTSDIEDVIIRE